MNTKHALLFLTIVALGLPGCGGVRKGDVAGAVKIDGAPLEEGGITFIPVDGPGGAVPEDIVKGEYRMRYGVVLGKQRVEIRAMKKTGKKIASHDGPEVMVDQRVQFIPDRYNDKTELFVDVKPGQNKLDFTLATK